MKDLARGAGATIKENEQKYASLNEFKIASTMCRTYGALTKYHIVVCC